LRWRHDARSHCKPATGAAGARQHSTATRRAVRAFQRPQGLDSGILSLRAGRQLGIIAYDPDELDTLDGFGRSG